MRINHFLFGLILGISLMLSSCFSDRSGKGDQTSMAGMHKVIVKEFQHTSTYTYLFVSEKGDKYWIAVPRMNVSEGDVLYYSESYEMKNFESRELSKTFESLLLVNDISTEPITDESETMMGGRTTQGKVSPARDNSIKVTPSEGDITIAELFQKKDSFAGQRVRMKGQVVRVNENIMGKNWIHIQDGTEHEGKFDLTVTSQDVAKAGDVIHLEGTIALDKDFGAGYVYDVIMEDAKILNP